MAALVAVVIATVATVARASPSEDVRAAAPQRIVVIAGGCELEAIDATALAAALRVEMIQEGVFVVDVAAPGSLAVEDPSVATVRLLPASCQAGVGVPGFEITDGATGRSVQGKLAIADIDRAIRARVAALVIAERLRASWTDVAEVPFTHETPAAAGGAHAGGGTPAPGGAQSLPEGSPALPAAPPPVTSSAPAGVETPQAMDHEPTQPPRRAEIGPSRDPIADRQMSTVATRRLVLGATLEGRLFFATATGLVGPRAFAVLPVPTSVLRIYVDGGMGWGTAHDVLGDVSVMLASGGLGFALAAGRGMLHLEVGPKAEIGWTWVRGVAKGSGSVGSSAGAALGAVSVVASGYVEIAPHFTVLAAMDLGFALSGIDAKADTRSIADTAGWMLCARAGLAYVF